jgi:CRISPR-associated endoribonuclease Cas6
MPLSIVLKLQHDFPLTDEHLGCQFQGWFFKSLEKINPQVADQLHQDNEIPAYTIANPVSTGKNESNSLNNCSFTRLTILDDSLKDFFLFEFLPKLDNDIPIRWMVFNLSSYIYSKNIDKWADFTTYASLSNNDYGENVKKAILNFKSPTQFRNGDIDIPIPDPMRIYANLLRSWNAFSPKEIMKIEKDWLAFAQKAILINRIYKLETKRITFSEGAATGFIGRVEFSLLPKKKLGIFYEPYYSRGCYIFGMLSAYSLFCGTGARTTIGFGQTYPEIC